jgi:hypothetical protein
MKAARRLAKRSLGRFIWRETYQCLRLPWKQAQAAAAALSAPADATDFRLLERSELRFYGRGGEYNLSTRFLDDLASREDLCFGAFAGGKLASYCFFALSPTAVDAYLRFHFPPRWVYVYKAFTLPAWRGKRLQQEVFLRAVPEVACWVQGLREPLGFVTLVVTDNAPSLSAFARLGFRPYESFPVLRIRSRPRRPWGAEDQRRAFYIQAAEETT